jgi:hypothetical protein
MAGSLVRPTLLLRFCNQVALLSPSLLGASTVFLKVRQAYSTSHTGQWRWHLVNGYSCFRDAAEAFLYVTDGLPLAQATRLTSTSGSGPRGNPCAVGSHSYRRVQTRENAELGEPERRKKPTMTRC